MAKNNNKVTYTTSLDAELLKKFRVYCVLNDVNQNQVIADLIKELLEKEGEVIGSTDK